MDYYQNFRAQLEAKEKEQNKRSIKVYEPIDAVRVKRNNQEFIMMASNNYLGLTHDLRVQQAAKYAVEQYGTGSGGARLTSGTFPLFNELELGIADFKHTEQALVFNTGYMANVGTITALMNKNSIIISDELNHASIIDGCRLSGARIERYNHKDIEHAEHILKNYKSSHKMIITDGVFSMDGDIAPLDKLYELGKEYNALLMVDDAHSTGVLGNGRGTAHHFGLTDVDVQLGTLSKALGSVGGYVAGRKELIEYLVNYSRSFIFSTALSPADIGAALEALTIVKNEPLVVEQLNENTAYMANKLQSMGIECDDETPIFPIIVGDNERALSLAYELELRGIIITAIRPPTVPVGESRLRMTVTAAHSQEQLDYVANTLRDLLVDMNI
ncbi:8-amino-7-oxononanoate synthase [Veillonella tobetsuensis]|uniref:8-amino-7-ketopelargonate synthase n=1 Tax=Veillonella tobetsuensis TaxID=1110546 RepID=A0A2S7ZP51_9FIRM|nr:8-amino-7-oxononanoate synthase [Veillonella tobetsuensis]MBF1756231.1 8-amino-7-oxononanoate synthase [Veillonella tobetsuensis]PQL24917.1 8-amino-7-oxononanoate synthase [Veillonella tobetsuensis]GCL69480.1 8-amino-7-oxononanoate synthase 1 [Veillonella tobetsuensis]